MRRAIRTVLTLLLAFVLLGLLSSCNDSSAVKVQLLKDISAKLPADARKQQIYQFISDEGITDPTYLEYHVDEQLNRDVLKRVIIANKVRKFLGFRTARVQMRFYLDAQEQLTDYEVKEVNTGV